MEPLKSEIQPELTKLATKINVQRGLIYKMLEEQVEDSTTIALMQSKLAQDKQPIVDALQKEVNKLTAAVNELREENDRLHLQIASMSEDESYQSLNEIRSPRNCS